MVSLLKNVNQNKVVCIQNWRVDLHFFFIYLSTKLKTIKIIFSKKDFERFQFFYKTEGEPKGVSINSFCVGNTFLTQHSTAGSKKHMRRLYL